MNNLDVKEELDNCLIELNHVKSLVDGLGIASAIAPYLTKYAVMDAEPNKANLLTSLQSLVDARNDFAHGGNPNATISDVLTYFTHARRIMEIMDDVIG